VTVADRWDLESPLSRAVRAATAKDGERLAVEDPQRPERSLTYAQLDSAADELAVGLLEMLGPNEHRVALRPTSARSTAIGLLAVNRAGMTPSQVDVGLPAERAAVVLSDLQPGLVLSDHEPDFAPGAFPTLGGQIRFTDPDSLRRLPRKGELPVPAALAARITYTSGSTGQPKGVVSGHPSDARPSISSYLEITRPVTFSADLHLAFVSRCLAIGSTLVIYDIRSMGVAPIGAWLRANKIDHVATVPTLARTLLATLGAAEQFPDLRAIQLSGERVLGSDVSRLLAHLPGGSLVQCTFGQTETDVIYESVFTRGTIPGDGPVPLLHPIEGVAVSIERPDGNLAGFGEEGEIVVASAITALGYWQRPELTAERFTDLGDGIRQVRTGDAGRLLADGTLEHLGRLDDMVKVAGNRVDLGDVEVALRSLPGIRDAAVVPYTDPVGDTRLWAYVVGETRQTDTVPTRVLRGSLARLLPRYMVPDHLEALSELPRLSGTKVDRQLLSRRAAAGDAATATPAEVNGNLVGQLCALWTEVLGRPDIGPDDDFFEQGGDSIRGARLLAAIERRFGLPRPVSMLLEFPTPSALAEALEHAGDDEWHSLVAVQPQGTRLPLCLVHDGSGEIVYGHRLAEALGPDQPVYAIRGAALAGTAPPQSSVAELAAHYVALLRQVAPVGPYAIYGPSVGGTIAFEMAVQLQRFGFDVPVLAIGDARWSEHDRPRGRQQLIALLRAKRLREAALLPVGHLRWQIRSRRRESERQEAPGDLLRQAFSLDYYGQLTQPYCPEEPFKGSPLVFRAMRTMQLPLDLRADLGWGAHCSGDPRTFDVPCLHTDLGTEAAVAFIAPALTAALHEASAAPSTKS
jgi:aspartate racemase